MSNNLWLNQKPVSVIDRIKQQITIPAFSFPCGLTNKSLGYPVGYTPDFRIEPVEVYPWSNAYGKVDAITLEFWIYVDLVTLFTIITKEDSYTNPLGPSPVLKIEHLASGKLSILFVTIDGDGNKVYNTFVSQSSIPSGKWVHVALTWDYSAEGQIARLYINGKQDIIGAAYGFFADYEGALKFGFTGLALNNYGRCFINELRIWKTKRTQEELLANANAPRNTIPDDGVDDDLVYYWRLNGDGIANLGGHDFTFFDSFPGAEAVSYWTSEYFYPRRYGASFICAEFTMPLGNKCSLKWPVRQPANINHALCCSWIDDKGVVQRRKLYGNVGEKIAPSPEVYKGEPMNSPFKLEIWNVDGNDTADLTKAIILPFSVTTLPKSSYDKTPFNYTVEATTNLGAAFPLVFPLQFNLNLEF
jgi:hypothetical protein